MFIHIGGNDMESDCSIEEVVYKLVAFVTLCQRQYNITRVTVLQLLPRTKTRHLAVPFYNGKVTAANRLLKGQLRPFRQCYYWNLKGMKGAEDTLASDGVHFSERGFGKYFKNIRAALLKFKNSGM